MTISYLVKLSLEAILWFK